MGKQWKQCQTLFWGLQNHCRWWLQPWNWKTLAPWRESYDEPKQHIKKQRDITLPSKVRLVKAMFFLVVMYRCESWTMKKTECWRIDAFELRLEKTLESPLDCMEIQPVYPKGNQSWIFIGRTDAETEAPYFGHLMWRTESLEKILMLQKIESRKRRGQQRTRCLDGITDSMDMILSKLRDWWWTGKPGVLQSTGSQRVRHDWMTELNRTALHTNSKFAFLHPLTEVMQWHSYCIISDDTWC